MTEVLNKIIYDCATGIETVIPLTPEEIAEIERSRVEEQTRREAFEAELAAKQAAKESAIAKLSALGLTAEEAAALLP